MAPPIPKVAPGELITAQFMNRVINAWNDLDRRVGDLEGSGTVVLTELSPVGSLRMASEVQVKGRNFGLPSQVTVSFDGTGAYLKPGSGDRLLVFDVPIIGGVGEAGVAMTMEIRAAAGTATERVMVLPPLALPTGDIVVSVTMPSVAKIDADTTYAFACSVNVRTSDNESFTMKAAAGTAQQAWVVAVTDQNKVPVSELFFPRSSVGTSKTIYLQVTIPAGVSGPARLSVVVTAKRNAAFTGSSGDQGFTVGAAPPPQPTFPVSVKVYDTTTGAELLPSPADSKLHLTAGVSYYTEVRAALPKAGTYSITARSLDRPDLWKFAPGFGTSLQVRAAGEALVDGTLIPAAGSPDSTFEIRFELQGDPQEFGLYAQSVTVG